MQELNPKASKNIKGGWGDVMMLLSHEWTLAPEIEWTLASDICHEWTLAPEIEWTLTPDIHFKTNSSLLINHFSFSKSL